MSRPTPAPRRTAFYIEPAALAALVRQHQETGVVSDELGRALLKLAGGVWERFRFIPDREEFTSAVVEHLLAAPLRGADPKRNLFAFFTTCACRFGSKLRNRAAAERRKFSEFAADRHRAGLVPEE